MTGRGQSGRHRRPTLSLLLVLGVAQLSGCANTGPSPAVAFDSGAVRDSVIRLEAAMNEAVDALDCTRGLASLGTAEPAFVSSGIVVRTAPELREMCEDMVTGRRGAHFDIETLTAHALSSDAAYVVREGDYTIDLLDGNSVTVPMVMTTIWQREPDGWKMMHLHESFVLPEAMGQQADSAQS